MDYDDVIFCGIGYALFLPLLSSYVTKHYFLTLKKRKTK